MYHFIVSLFVLFPFIAFTQVNKKITFSGYTEAYYAWDSDKPANHERANFIYNHKRHNELNINLALAKINYIDTFVRANAGVMVGNYAQYNLANEPTLFQSIYEANVGFKISKNNNTWVDIGILPSHIGFESAIGADCWTASRSIASDNSPYFETGIKLTHTNSKENFYYSFLVLNGWQRIQKPNGTQMPSLGMQFNYKPTNAITLNYSNFIGTDKPDSAKALRTYHNLYFILEKPRISITAGLDIGSDKYTSTTYGLWYSPVIIARTSIYSRSKIAARIEYFNDKKQVLIPTNTINGFQTTGFSINYDYTIYKKITFRLEGKAYLSTNKIFNNNTRTTNYSILSSICCKW